MFCSFKAKKDAIAIYTPERPYTMYVGTQGEKKIWLQNLQQTIQKDLTGNKTSTENINTGIRRYRYYNDKQFSVITLSIVFSV